MKRSGQVLLEVLVTGILLVIVLPHVAPLCWRYFGPNPAEVSVLLLQNRYLLEVSETKKVQADVLERLSAIRRHSREVARKAEADKIESDHQEALRLYDAFSDRQANLYAKCLTEVRGKMNKIQKDDMIYKIWMSSPSDNNDCSDVAALKLSEVASR